MEPLRRIATQAQAAAGTENTRTMTPLRVAQAITALSPAPTIASQAEAEAGTDNTKFMTPLRTSQEITALAPKSKLVQVVDGSTTSNFQTSTQMTASSDVAATSSQGAEIATATITPGSTNNFLEFEVSFYVEVTGATTPAFALFKDSDANSTRSSFAATSASSGHKNLISCKWRVQVASTSSQTWKLRAGPDSAVTLNINRIAAGSRFGTTDYITFIVREVLP